MSSPNKRPSYFLRSAFVAVAVLGAFAVMAQEGKQIETPATNAQDAKDLDSKPVNEREEKRVRMNRPEEKITPETAILRFESFNAIKTKVAEDGSLIITDIKDESRAARQGLKKNDRIVLIDGQKLESPNHAATVLTRTATQPYHIVMVARDGEEPMEVILGTHLELLGMLLVPDTSSRPMVRSVQEGSPAAEAGLRAEDIIVGVSGRETDTYKKFDDFVIPLLRKMSPGQELNLRVIRDAKEAEVTVIRPEQLKLPLVDVPPARAVLNRVDAAPLPIVPAEPVVNTTYEFLTGFMGLPTAVPFIAGILPDGFASVPSDSVVAVLQPDVFNSFNARVAVPVNSAVPVAPPVPVETRVVPRQQLRQVLPNSPTVVEPAVEGPATTVAPGVVADPHVVNTVPAATTGNGVRGFVVVSHEATGMFIRARLMGLVPSSSYTLAVHQLGDIGAVNQNSAGPVIAVLGVVQADAAGQTDVTFPVNALMQPARLLGRAVSLLAGLPTVNPTIATTAVATLPGVDVKDDTFLPGISGVTNGFSYHACGVFGYASPARFNNGALIVP